MTVFRSIHFWNIVSSICRPRFKIQYFKLQIIDKYYFWFLQIYYILLNFLSHYREIVILWFIYCSAPTEHWPSTESHTSPSNNEEWWLEITRRCRTKTEETTVYRTLMIGCDHPNCIRAESISISDYFTFYVKGLTKWIGKRHLTF